MFQPVGELAEVAKKNRVKENPAGPPAFKANRGLRA